MKKAFTLIELLVVVLIIGILAAIALPQYTQTVNKSRAVQALVMLRALADAQEAFFLANGDYTNELTELDVQIPENLKGSADNWNATESDHPNQYMFFCLNKRGCQAFAINPDLPAFEFHVLNPPPGEYQKQAGKHWCKLTQNNRTARAKKLCLSLGGVLDRADEYPEGKYYLLN